MSDFGDFDPDEIPPPSPDQPNFEPVGLGSPGNPASIPPPSPDQPNFEPVGLGSPGDPASIPPPSPDQPNFEPVGLGSQRPGGPLPRQPRSPSAGGGGLRGILIGLLLPAVLVGAVLAMPFINGTTNPPYPPIRPFVDLSCGARLVFPDIIREFYVPVICDFYPFEGETITPPGPADACGQACDLAIGRGCPATFNCISGTCQSSVYCSSVCGESCSTDADCPGGLSCIEYCVEDASGGCTNTFLCYNFTACSMPPEEACLASCDDNQDCAPGLNCRFGYCSSQNENFCDGCGLDCTTDADCPSGFSCRGPSQGDGTSAPGGYGYYGMSCWNEATCGPLPDYAAGPIDVGLSCGDGICSASEVDTCCGLGMDCTVAITCGDGICSACESADSCPTDCASAPTCDSSPPWCGNGACEPGCGETDQTCPQDCAAVPAGAAACGSACSTDADCAGLGPNPACADGFCYDAQTCGGDTGTGSGNGDKDKDNPTCVFDQGDGICCKAAGENEQTSPNECTP